MPPRPVPGRAGAAFRSRFSGHVGFGVVRSLGFRTVRLERDGELFRLRQISQIAEAEQLDKQRGSPVEEWSPESFAPADDFEQSPLLKRTQYAAGRHASDLFDLGSADRLTVGDDGQRFEGCSGETGSTGRELGPLDRRGMYRPGQDLIAPGQLYQLHTVLVEVEVLAQLVKRGSHIGQGCFYIEGRELFHRQWSRGGEERRLTQLGERIHGRSPSAQRAPVAGVEARPAEPTRAGQGGQTASRRSSAPGPVRRANRSRREPRAELRSAEWRLRHRAGERPPDAEPELGWRQLPGRRPAADPEDRASAAAEAYQEGAADSLERVARSGVLQRIPSTARSP